jgi:superfamily II DNA or RNA helicase
MIHLRPYQLNDVLRIREAFGRRQKKRPLYVLPTGAGKTVMFAHITAGAAAKGHRVLILCHRIELLDQISGALTDTGTEHGFIAGGYAKELRQTMIASVQTLVRRLDTIPQPGLIVVDEAHHARAATYEAILDAYPNAKVLAVTATPIRQSGEGLGKLFDDMILGPSMRELMDQGYLAKYRLFAPPTVKTDALHTRAAEFITSETEALMNKPAITGRALDHYRKHADNLPALIFCTSVKHATDVAVQFRDAGYSAVTLNGAMDREIRRGIVADFRRGAIKIITSCEVLSEGFDVPGAHCGIFLRPTQSVGLYLQQIGRILRPCEGKSHAILLDHVNNAMLHGLPDTPRQWSLDGEDRKKKPKAPSVRVCPSCWRALPSATRECPAPCGHVFAVESRTIRELDGELAELTVEEYQRRQERKSDGWDRHNAQTLESLRAFAKRKNYKPGWAEKVFAARLAKKQASSQTGA